jgi:hypothetical protein
MSIARRHRPAIMKDEGPGEIFSKKELEFFGPGGFK